MALVDQPDTERLPSELGPPSYAASATGAMHDQSDRLRGTCGGHPPRLPAASRS
jgi:hypothetical protein